MSDAVADPAPIDGFALRSCLARFATGVTVVAVDGPEGPLALTVNSFSTVSLEPPLVLVSIRKQSRIHDAFVDRPFSVNVLGAEQERHALHFAGRPQLDRIEWVDRTDAPCLAGSLAVLECAPWASYEGGDHTIVVGRVTGFGYRPGDALLYFCGRFAAQAEPIHGIEFLF